MIEISIGNLYSKVTKKKATRDELVAIHEILAVKVPGCYFSKAYRRGMWDGQRKFFNMLSGAFYTGLLGYLLRKLQVYNFEISIIDKRLYIPHLNKDLDLDGIVLRDYQRRMVEDAITHERGIISAPPNAGKTEVACGIIKVLGLPANFFTHRLTLLRQTKERMEKRLGIEVGIVGGGEMILKDVNILSVATISKKITEPSIAGLLQATPIIISDECLPGESRVLLPDNVSVSIKDVVENQNTIKSVMSYDLEHKVYEEKRILRYIKLPGKIPWSKITLENLDGDKEINFNCTKDHRIFVVGKGYIKVENLSINDVVVYNELPNSPKYICKICGKFFGSKSIGGHVSNHGENKGLLKFKEYIKNNGSPMKNPETAKKTSESLKKLFSFDKTHSIASSNRMKLNNPMKNPDYVKKSVSSWKKTFENNPDKIFKRNKNWIRAPRKCNFPTRPEKVVINFNIPELEYVGDGKFWIKLENGKYKNPDFICKSQNKVVEVGDTEYWYGRRDPFRIENLLKKYNGSGYSVIFIGSEELYSNPELCKGKILSFLFNHNYTVKKIKLYSNNKIPKFVYNLEIEDNHNFFADNILVSNCHRISSKTWETCLKACSGAYYRYGLSATPLMRDEISNMLVRGLTGDEITGITNLELISRGISAFPSVYLIGITEPKISDVYTFDEAYEHGVLYNVDRNQKIVKSAKKFLDLGKSVFILVWRIAHGDLLLDLLKNEGIEAEFIKGGGQSESIKTNDSIKRFSNKKLKCLISSTISDEGLDVPAMDVLIMAVGFKAPSRVYQRVGRGLRKKIVGDNVVTIIDFVDFHNKKYLFRHSKDRMKEFVKMGIEMFEVKDIDSWEFEKV